MDQGTGVAALEGESAAVAEDATRAATRGAAETAKAVHRNSIYGLEVWYEELREKLLTQGGEMLGNDEADMALVAELTESRIERLMLMAREERAFAATVDAEIARLEELKRPHARLVSTIEGHVLAQMIAMGIPKVSTPRIMVSLTANSAGKVALKAGIEADALPAEFVRVVPEQRLPDVKAAAAAQKGGTDISAWFDVTPPGFHLRVK